MNKIKKVAIDKLSKEMPKELSPSEKLIYEWLYKQKDISLYKGILDPKKSVKNAYQYAYSQATQYQVGGCAIIHHEMVFLWVANYFKEPLIIATDDFAIEMLKKATKKNDEPKKQMNINTVKPKKVESTKEQPKMIEKKSKMMEGEQLSLLDFI